MKALVVYGSKRGGTQGLAEMLGDGLAEQGLAVTVRSAADKTRDLASYDLVVVGGALYANLWHKDARRFVHRNAGFLRDKPVWLFSSGPLGPEPPEAATIDPTEQVRELMKAVGARGHRTFGGRLSPEAKGFPASAMARWRSGDWRDHEDVRLWAKEIVAEMEEPPVEESTDGR